MVTGLTFFKLDPAALLVAQFEEYFAEQVLQVLLGAWYGIGRVADEFGIAYVECGGEAVGRRVDRVDVAPAQTSYRLAGARTLVTLMR